MDFLVGDTTGLLRRVDAARRCTYTYKILPQDRNEGVCCSCWSGGQGLSFTAASEAELTLGRRSGRVEAIAPALPPRVRAGAAAVSSSSSSSSSSVPHLLIRSRYTATAPVIRCFQMPAACVQLGLLHEPQDRLLLNAAARDDLMHHDTFFSVFNSLCPLSPSPLLPTPHRPSRPRGATDPRTPRASAAGAEEVKSAKGIEEAVEASEGASLTEEPRQLFCIDEVGHLVLLDWKGSFFEQLRSDFVSDSSSSDSTAKVTPIYMNSVPSYTVNEPKQSFRNSSSSSSNREREDVCSRDSSCDVDYNNSGSGQRRSTSSTTVHSASSQPASLTAGRPTGDPWYCWSLHTADEEDEVATHIRAAWRVCGPVSCATPVNPLLPDRIAFGGKNNDVKVFDFSREKYIWAAKNVKSTLLRLQVPVHVSSICWMPQMHPLVLAAGTAAGALRLYDLRCQRRPVFEQQYACSSSSLGGASAREPRHLSALCTETLNEEAAAVLAQFRYCISKCNNSSRSNNATWTNREAEGDLSSSYCGSNTSPHGASINWKEERNIIKSSSKANVGLGHGNRSEGSQARTSISAGTARVPEDEENRMKEAVAAVRSLYGREKARVFFSDNYGAVYVHRVLTGMSLLRRIDPQQKKYNKTSWYAVSSSSEAETEDEDEDNESQHAGSTDAEDDELKEGESEGEKGSETAGEEGGESEEEEEDGGEGGDGHGGREDIRKKVQLKKQIKGQQQQRQTNDKTVLQRKDKMRRRSLSKVTGGEEADANVSTADNSTGGGDAMQSETASETESELSDSLATPRARRVDAAAEKEPVYNERMAMQLLRRHKLKRMLKLSTIKNSGKLSQAAIHGAQYMTLFEGCYKGAMGAVVALTVDTSKGLLVGAGYGRHVLVWNVRSRKLLFKVYLKQQIRTIVLRCRRGVKGHELEVLEEQEKQNTQLQEEHQLQKHQGVSNVWKQKPQQQRKPQRMDNKQKQSKQLQQLPQLRSSIPQRKTKTFHQEEDADTFISTKNSKQQEKSVPQSQAQRNRLRQQLYERQHHTSKRQEVKSIEEGADDGDGDGRGRKRSATEKGGIAVVRKQKSGLSRVKEKKKKRKTM